MTIINLTVYRNKLRQGWFLKHRRKLEKITCNFLDIAIGIPFEDLQHIHIQQSKSELMESWDYIDFRELLFESMEKIISEHLWEELSCYRWFNPQLFTKEELVYFAFNLYIDKNNNNLGRVYRG